MKPKKSSAVAAPILGMMSPNLKSRIMLRLASICISLATFMCIATDKVQAEDFGRFDGAVWQYEMSMVKRNGESRKGGFRINGSDIFQPRDKKPTKIGTIPNKPKGKPMIGDKTRLEFHELGGSDMKRIKCAGVVTLKSFGEVEGRLIDADGAHWNFKASRVQE